MRFAWLLALPFFASCDPAHGAGFAVAPQPGSHVEILAASLYDLVGRVSSKYGLQEEAPVADSQWRFCLVGSATLCAKTNDTEIQFNLHEWGARRAFSPRIDSLRRELTDSLREKYGNNSIHDCEWANSALRVGGEVTNVLVCTPPRRKSR